MQARFGGLPSRLEAASIWRDIWREEVHNSTAIEGNTLVQHEVDQLLEHRLTGPRRKDLTEYLIVQGYGKAAEWVYEVGIDPDGGWSSGQLLTLAEVREVHTTTMGLAWEVAPPPHALRDERPGQFRQHEVQIFTSGMQPPTWPLVSAEMDEWIGQVNRLRRAGSYPIDQISADTG